MVSMVSADLSASLRLIPDVFRMDSTVRGRNVQQENLSRGDGVLVRGCDGALVEGIVWEVRQDGVLICSERQFEWLKSGDDHAAPIGFPWKDVVLDRS